MTLAEILPIVRELPPEEKLRLIRILAEELDTSEDVRPLVPHRVYYLATPYGVSGAGRALMNASAAAEKVR